MNDDRLGCRLGNLLLAVLVLLTGQTWAAAGFTTAFDHVTAGSALELAWDSVAAQYYPLCVTVQLVEKSAGGSKVNAYKANVTANATGNTFTWSHVPFPLHYVPTGMYQLELRPAAWASGHPPLLAKSTFFTIKEKTSATGPSLSPPPTLVGYKSGAATINRPLAIGLGVAIGIPSVVALAIVSWCFRKRQRRATLEKRRRMRSEFIIN